MNQRVCFSPSIAIVACAGLLAITLPPARTSAAPPLDVSGHTRITNIMHDGSLCPAESPLELTSEDERAQIALRALLSTDGEDLTQVGHEVRGDCTVVLDVELTPGYQLRAVQAAARVKTHLTGGAGYVIGMMHGTEGDPADSSALRSTKSGEDELTVATERWIPGPCRSQVRVYVRLDALLYRDRQGEGTPLFGEVTLERLDIDLTPRGLSWCGDDP